MRVKGWASFGDGSWGYSSYNWAFSCGLKCGKVGKGWRNSIARKAFALHMAGLRPIPGIHMVS